MLSTVHSQCISWLVLDGSDGRRPVVVSDLQVETWRVMGCHLTNSIRHLSRYSTFAYALYVQPQVIIAVDRIRLARRDENPVSLDSEISSMKARSA